MRGMFTKFVFLAIIVAVVATDIEWDWTPNPYLPALIGTGAAYGLFWLWDYCGRSSIWGRAKSS